MNNLKFNICPERNALGVQHSTLEVTLLTNKKGKNNAND